jgi:hypothetical protein
LGGNPLPQAQSSDELPGRANYFIGQDPARWRANLPNYGKIKYDNLYPGIAAVYYGRQQGFEYDFVVSPGADPAVIKLALTGARKLALDKHGNLLARLGAGVLRHRAPYIYQEINGEKRAVAGRYVVTGRNTFGFAIGKYDRSLPLVIDPVAEYATYWGGSAGGDSGAAIAVDQHGAAYVTGVALSVDFPDTPARPNHPNYQDAFVTKFDPDGVNAIYTTFLGGTYADEGAAIAVDAGGQAYVTGVTYSADFYTRNAAQPVGGVVADAVPDGFAAKLNADGTVAYSTYLGGSGYEQGYGIAADDAGRAYVTGYTTSADFPTLRALQTARRGGADAYLTALSPAGAMLSSTYLGGDGNDEGWDVAVSAQNGIYFTGRASAGLTPTASAYRASGGGFAARLHFDAVNSALVLDYLTYLDQRGTSLAVDGGGHAIISTNTFAKLSGREGNFRLMNTA